MSSKPTPFDPMPTTVQEKEFDSSIRMSLDPGAGREFPNIYWGTKTYAGLRIIDGEVHVALKGWRRVPEEVLYGPDGVSRGLAMWFGNMGGDPQGIPRYTWVLVDARTGDFI